MPVSGRTRIPDLVMHLGPELLQLGIVRRLDPEDGAAQDQQFAHDGDILLQINIC